MEKNAFETYTYLQTNNVEAGAGQFYVIEDEAAFLVNREVQYVAQAQDSKDPCDNSQTCTVYDVSPQQFFVDVSENSTELISVADNYILPVADGEGDGLYENSFLLQAVSSEHPEQVHKDLPDNLKETDAQHEVEVDNGNDKLANKYTEITLTDDQYKTLEQKGLVLLVENDKSFILDTYGLHEITGNHDLIQSLKSDSNSEIKTDLEQEQIRPCLEPGRSVESGQNVKCNDNENELIGSSNFKQEPLNVDDRKDEPENDPQIVPDKIENQPESEPPKKPRQPYRIKIKTKCCFKNIPDKIYLGKTLNGKKLVAKVVKRTTDEIKQKRGPPEMKPPKKKMSVQTQRITSQETESQFRKLLQQALDGEIEYTLDDITSAAEIVVQLSQLPAFRSSVGGRHVIITKCAGKNNKGTSTQQTAFITGTVTSHENGTCSFLHVPDLLQKLMTQNICAELDTKASRTSRSILKPKLQLTQKNSTVLHVHISETKYGDAVEALSVNLQERVLPCEILTAKQQPASKPVTKLFACVICAKLFQTIMDLMEHQENMHLVDSEDKLTIDTDDLPKDTMLKTLVKTGKEYACLHCDMRFNTRFLCLRHMNTHSHDHQAAPIESDKKESKIHYETYQPGPLYKCQMCSCSYFYQSSLSKHISKVHLSDKILNSN